jgi:hypothetical protein
VTDFRFDVLHIAPAILAAILQPKNTRSRVWRLPVPADCELVKTALNPVIGRLLPDERAYNNMVAPLSRGVGTDNTTPSDAREELSINPTAWLLVLRLLLIPG